MTLLFIFGLLIVAVATAAFVRSQPEPKPARIKPAPLPEHIRRHMAAQDRGDFNR